MNRKILYLLEIIYMMFFLVPGARADGIIVPDPPICDGRPCFDPGFPIPMAQLEIRYHHVTVTIEDQVAITRVDQVFHNPNDWTVEGMYIFPLPRDAAVSGFRLWIDGEPVEGEVLDADQARRTYEEIVRQLIDPALLEYAEQGAVRARVFPILPGDERRIELEYTQALAADNGLVKYQYPLNTEKFSTELLDEVRVSVDVRAQAPIRAIYSPSHPVDIAWEAREHVRAGYEETDVRPDTDFTLYYSLGETEAFHLLTYRDAADPADPDGFFLLLLAPRPDAGVRTVPKDVLLVLDRSGSMEGEKFRQAQTALQFILQNLNAEDRFNVITFSTGLDSFSTRMEPVSEVGEASDWVDRLSAGGSTDINRALLEAASLADRERPTYLIFLTDGLPTEGVTDNQQILDNMAINAPDNLRLFSFGVGYDVDTFLLDSLAQAHHGTSTYVVPGDRLDENISAFYEKISTPVLTDLELDFGDIVAYDLYPSPLPDLFVGSQIILVGRYRQGGETTVTLRGEVDGRIETFRFPEQVFARGSRGEGEFVTALPRLWATRKIGSLLNQIRLQGPEEEVIDQIVRLSIRYGIVTPYTSYLVTEPMPLGAAAQDQIVSEQFSALQGLPAEPSFGQDAVERAAAQGDLAEAEAPVPFAGEGAGEIVRIVGARTYVNASGVWVDTAFDPESMITVPVAFLSPDYFALLRSRPELAPAFALGGQVIAFADGVAYEVVPAEIAVAPLEVPPAQDPIAGTEAPAQGPGGPPVLPGETEPAPPAAPGTLPGCMGGLLPLAVIAVGAYSVRRRVVK